MGAKKAKFDVSLTPQFPAYVGYADYYFSTPASLIIRNDGAENLLLDVRIGNKDGLFAAFEKEVEIPFESSVELPAAVLSPLYLSECDELTPCTGSASLLIGGKEIASAQFPITALPFDWWEGLLGNTERLAAYVRPAMPESTVLLSDAGNRLKVWGSDRLNGYENADKNAVRSLFAAVFAVIKGKLFQSTGEIDCTKPLSCMHEGLLKERRASALELAVLACSCLEAAGLNPVLAVGKTDAGVGVWLHKSCFLDSVTDDRETVSKYLSDGVNNLAFFDAEDLFSDKKGSYTISEGHFKTKLSKGRYEAFVDIRRCRMGGVKSCPMRGKGIAGYEIYKEEDTGDSAPAPLPAYHKLSLDGKQPRNRRWERRLLDLTGKNALLNFTGKNALHIVSSGTDETVLALEKDLRLKGGDETAPPFGDRTEGQKRELIRLEQEKGVFRVYESQEKTSEIADRLFRKNREASEETGARILYLAIGFLCYIRENEERYAPLVLAPVGLKKARGTDDFSVTEGKEYFVNATLLEFLKQEYNIDIRGLGGNVSSLKPAEILAMVRAETARMKGWKVVEDVYLAALSFERFLLWNDLRCSSEEFGANPLFSALVEGKYEGNGGSAPEEDAANPADLFIPLPSDSSQFSAISLSDAGESFVLHGPPGTGKSQTIANIIANAVAKGRRVLFVAEKKAALDVVKKRLDGVGIGDFCLELHGVKADKAEALRSIERTLSLTGGEDLGYAAGASETEKLRRELLAPMHALHKKRRLGLSVYRAIVGYLENKNAPDIVDIESSFYDSLTEQKLIEYKNMILSAAAAAKECGGVSSSPFENVNLTSYSQTLRDKVFCASEVVIAESRHLKAFLSLFLEFYRQRVSALTERKIKGLASLAKDLLAGRYDKYFATETESFSRFYGANRRLDGCLAYYFKYFKALVEPDDRAELAAVREGGDWKLYRGAKSTLKKLSRVALAPIAEEDVPKFLITLADIADASDRVAECDLSKTFCDRFGRINYKRRAEFLDDLYKLHESAASLFLDYNPEAFISMCCRAASGYTAPVLEGYVKAADSFFAALDRFLSVTNADRQKNRDEDLPDFYAQKAGALIDNIDMLSNWCMYRATAQTLKKSGLNFLADALESGRLKVENLLAGFEKNVYKNFLETTIPSDAALSRMTAGTLEDTAEKFRIAQENFNRLTRTHLREILISRLSDEALGSEKSTFYRLSKGNLRGSSLRALFEEIPTLLGVAAPCMLMSPITVAQYLRPRANLFDLVVFDEASQMSTAEAAGSIARGKAAIVVGDPKQLPPTSFFHADATDEDEIENEDLESVLDDCLALGLPERHLLWHYRSKHESLIAFSNSMYYGNRLCTFPSPDALEQKVKLIETDGLYDRGGTKRNKKEAEALVSEVVRRLKDPLLSRSSMGIVTFSSAQQEELEKVLSKAIAANKLEEAAYEREEPLFIKNLENVQGDERDVILFSVCYGPDQTGKLSLNFGPLNQSGGWRRLNVAVSRAREEMLVFSSMTAAMIDPRKTSSTGVANLKAFLEFAEKGRTTLAVKSSDVRMGTGIGKFIAREIETLGYECRVDVGASDFKIDVAVIDPKDKNRFILGILCDGNDRFSVKDRTILQPQILKRGNWNILRMNSVSYFNNPKREIKRVKDMLDRLTGAPRRAGAWLAKVKKPYKYVKTSAAETLSFLTDNNDGEISARLIEIVSAEEPISRAFLKKRLLSSFGIEKSSARAESKLDQLIDGCKFKKERAAGVEYLFKSPRATALGKVRTEDDSRLRRIPEDFTVYEIASLVKAALEERISLYLSEINEIVGQVLKVRMTERMTAFVRDCVLWGESQGLFVCSVSDRVSLS